METFWNQRYRQEAFAYGKAPNQYFKENIQKLNPGKILFPAEGEGRNAVYAAQLGWDVYAFDISEEGKTKAKKWARENKVSINYQVGQLPDLNFWERNIRCDCPGLCPFSTEHQGGIPPIARQKAKKRRHGHFRGLLQKQPGLSEKEPGYRGTFGQRSPVFDRGTGVLF